MATVGLEEEDVPLGDLVFSVEEGAEVALGDREWEGLRLPKGAILEVALHGSSIGLGAEAWFAMAIGRVDHSAPLGTVVSGPFLGCEEETYIEEVST